MSLAISREIYVGVVNWICERMAKENELESTLESALQKYFDNNEGDSSIMLIDNHLNSLISLMEVATHDSPEPHGSYLSWWLFECEAGEDIYQREAEVIVDDVPLNLKDAGELYDYLMGRGEDELTS